MKNKVLCDGCSNAVILGTPRQRDGDKRTWCNKRGIFIRNRKLKRGVRCSQKDY
jgi:hypothetical protein